MPKVGLNTTDDRLGVNFIKQAHGVGATAAVNNFRFYAGVASLEFAGRSLAP